MIPVEDKSMVGISALYSDEASLFLNRFYEAQSSMLHFPSYTASTLFEDTFFLVGSTSFEQYPITCFEDATTFIVLEGMIYNIDETSIRQHLFEIAQKTHAEIQQKKQISSLLQNADGEFIVIIYNKITKDLCVFNDSQGGSLERMYVIPSKLFICGRPL
jgi:hypothetical protein